MQLSPEQRAAVERTAQDVCCVAGPGSGKTAVLVRRFAHLVEQGVPAHSILAITFTEKAATQIKARLVAHFATNDDRRREVERAEVSTIHAFCLGLLKEHSIAAGLDPQFKVMDEQESATERGAAMEAVLDRIAAQRGEEFSRLVDLWAVHDPASALLGIYDDLRMGGGARRALDRPQLFDPAPVAAEIESTALWMLDGPEPTTPAGRNRVSSLRAWLAARPETPLWEWLEALPCDKRSFKAGHPMYDGADRIRALAAQAKSHWIGAQTAPQRALVREALVDFDADYRRRKRSRSLLDFGDLEECAAELLERDAQVRDTVRDRYDAILMDELQDTNPLQWRIVNLVRRPGRFFAVGDVNQSIYGFRFAAPEQFSAFQQQVASAGGAIDRLEANYRSRAEILETVTAVTVSQRCAGVSQHRLVPGRAIAPAEGPVVELQRVESQDGIEEALWIAHRLRQLHGTPLAGSPPRPARYSDMAVLVRTNKQLDALEAALARFGIACVLTRGRNFFEEPEIVDLTNWLRVMENAASEVALAGLLRSPLFGVSDEEMMRQRLAHGGLAPQSARATIAQARALRDELPPDLALASMLDQTGYLLRASRRARANVDKFLRLLRELHHAAPGDLAAHLEQIDRLRATGREPNAPEVEAGDAVELLSVHTAKGLEFPIVVVASLERGANGPAESIGWSEPSGLGLRWRTPDALNSINDPALEACLSLRKERETAEEDRLLYVAMTRAEQRLILSFTERKRSVGRWAKQVETGLAVVWPKQVGAPSVTGPLRVVRLSGEPAVEPAESAAPGDGAAVPLEPSAEPCEASAGLSVTSLTLFEACPRRYLLSSLLIWPQPPAVGGTGARALGTEVHELLSGDRTEASPEARALARVFEQSQLGARAGAALRSGREMDFLELVHGTLLRGQIDLWFEDAAGLVVVDYKTDRVLNAARLRGYELQLRLYALALERRFGRKVDEAWLFGLRDGGSHPVDLSPAALTAARTSLDRWRAAEQAGEFPLHESADCRWCPYVAGACPAAQPEV